jgi:hypothetical protein
MLKQKTKIVGLLDELLNFALLSEPKKVTFTVEELEERVQITVESVGSRIGERECRQGERLLNAPRRNELADYYGGLAGEESCAPCNLRMVGMMVDGGRIETDGAGIQITVWWKPE